MILRRFEGGPFQENGYLVVCEATGTAAAVDPGGGTPEMVRTLEAEGWTLSAVLLTHAHLDHVDGIPLLRTHHPGVPIHLHPADRPLYDAAPAQAAMFGLPAPDLPGIDGDLTPGRSVRVGDVTLEVAFAPGHAPGHVILSHAATDTALVGDVVFRGSIGRTDLPGGDGPTLMASIRDRILSLPDRTRLFPGHGPETTVGIERRTNPFLLEIQRG